MQTSFPSWAIIEESIQVDGNSCSTPEFRSIRQYSPAPRLIQEFPRAQRRQDETYQDLEEGTLAYGSRISREPFVRIRELSEV